MIELLQSNSFLTVSSFLEKLTLSEFHCLLTSGYSTLTMGMVAVFVSFGMSAPHLMAASVMSAPGGLVLAHLLYPESEQSHVPKEKAEFPKRLVVVAFLYISAYPMYD